MGAHVLTPIDGSPQSMTALRFAAEEWPDAEFTLLHVINPLQVRSGASTIHSGSEVWYERAKADAEELFERAREEVPLSFDQMIEVGRPSRVIVETAEEGQHDHIVMGSHGRRGVSRILLGSVAEFVARKSPVPVTIVR